MKNARPHPRKFVIAPPRSSCEIIARKTVIGTPCRCPVCHVRIEYQRRARYPTTGGRGREDDEPDIGCETASYMTGEIVTIDGGLAEG
jgi:hypothetical protein